MKSFCCILLCLCFAQGISLLIGSQTCIHDEIISNRNEGYIYGSSSERNNFCIQVKVPSNYYLRVTIKELEFREKPCSDVFLRVSSESLPRKFCSSDKSSVPEDLLFLGDVTVHAKLFPARDPPYDWRESRYRHVHFNLTYSLESIVCAQMQSFRCSKHQCVRKDLVCNRIKDCDNGLDEEGCATGVAAVSGVNSSRTDVLEKLKSKRSTDFGWGDNTHRAIIALFLAGGATFADSSNLEEEMMKKELELKFLLALLGNSTDSMEVVELGIFLNSLTVTCHNTRQFYGHNLLQTLGSRVVNSVIPFPGASLALCISNWTLPESKVRSLLRILEEESEYPFIFDIQAMAVMALTCIQRKTKTLETISNATETYYATIEKFISNQHPDGSFGNVYTTAIIAQALLSSGQETNNKWNITATVKYLMKEVEQSTDLLASYLVVPLFNNKTLLDVSDSHCVKTKNFTGDGVDDLVNKLGKKIRVQFSLYIGDLKDVVHTIFLRVPEKSSAFDVMRIAQANDAKYKFSHRYYGKHLYVYSIAGIYNDPEALKFWLLYTSSFKDSEPVQFTKSPDKLIVRKEQHLIMWFRTVPSLHDDIDVNDEVTTVENEHPLGKEESKMDEDKEIRNLLILDRGTKIKKLKPVLSSENSILDRR